MNMRLHVVGSGAIGSLLAFHLRRHTQHQLVLHYRRQPPLGSDRIGFVPVDGKFDDVEVEHGFDVEYPSGTAKSGESLEAAAFTTKAQQLQSAVEQLKDRISSQTAVLLLSNGLLSVLPGVLKTLSQLPDKRPTIILGHTSHGVNRMTNDARFPVWRHSGPATMTCSVLPTGTAGPNYNASTLTTALSQCPDLRVRHVPIVSWVNSALMKLAANCAANAATALIDDRVSSLLTPYGRPFLRAVSQEIAAVLGARTTRGTIAQLINSPEFLESEILTAQTLFEKILEIMEANRESNTSTLTDVRRIRTDSTMAERPAVQGESGSCTELEHINGYISHLGRECGVNTPLNDALRALVNAKCEALGRRR